MLGCPHPQAHSYLARPVSGFYLPTAVHRTEGEWPSHHCVSGRNQSEHGGCGLTHLGRHWEAQLHTCMCETVCVQSYAFDCVHVVVCIQL